MVEGTGVWADGVISASFGAFEKMEDSVSAWPSEPRAAPPTAAPSMPMTRAAAAVLRMFCCWW